MGRSQSWASWTDMKLTLLIKPEASHDISDAYAWYKSERPGLRKNFADAFEQACERVLFDPESFAAVVGFVRWVPLKRFPHGVYFLVEADRVVVLAVLHGRRSLKTLAERI